MLSYNVAEMIIILFYAVHVALINVKSNKNNVILCKQIAFENCDGHCYGS